mmetsp:Transcript_94151/g.177048  ORF Transcript_94151/g.177048 Transcript_94151/m.177048 type:complete len:455 (+) Transcript_94151:51-1415(+)
MSSKFSSSNPSRQESAGSSRDLEAVDSQPTLTDRKPGKYQVIVNDIVLTRLKNAFHDLGERPCSDSMTYDSHKLLGWSVFSIWGDHTAFATRRMWKIVFCLIMISTVTAIPVMCFIPDASEVKSSKFQDIINFLRFFVGLLLGFFLSSSVNRWYECVSGFLELFDAIRNLQMQFYALGVAKEKIYTCIRYGVLSGLLLSHELQLEKVPFEQKRAALKKMWEDVTDEGEITSDRGHYRLLSPDEVEVLESVENPECDVSVSSCMWMWVGSLVGRLAQDGEIPAMQSPTYGRIMNICQNAHSGIRKVRASVSVQVPFVYAHTLSILVHINNFFSALSFGITLGLTCGSWWMMTKGHHPLRPELHFEVTRADMYRDIENLVVSFVTGMIGPFIYHLLLDVSICIAQPFHCQEAMIPTDKLLSVLEKDLQDAKLMAEHPALWDAPYFKEPAKATRANI